MYYCDSFAWKYISNCPLCSDWNNQNICEYLVGNWTSFQPCSLPASVADAGPGLLPPSLPPPRVTGPPATLGGRVKTKWSLFAVVTTVSSRLLKYRSAIIFQKQALIFQNTLRKKSADSKTSRGIMTKQRGAVFVQGNLPDSIAYENWCLTFLKKRCRAQMKRPKCFWYTQNIF